MELLEWGDTIEADEIVLPDVIGDCSATIAVFKSLPTYVWNRGNKYMAVLQGVNMDELKACLDLYLHRDEIVTIAFPRALNRDDPYGRRDAVNVLAEEIHVAGKQIHCLGASAPANEAKELAQMGTVRSIDTSLPVVYGLEGHALDHFRYISRQDFFFGDFGVSDEIMEVIDDNLRTYRAWCNPEAS